MLRFIAWLFNGCPICHGLFTFEKPQNKRLRFCPKCGNTFDVILWKER